MSVLASVTSLPAVAQGTDDLAALNTQVTELYRAGKYAEAAEIAKRSLAVAEKQFGLDHSQVGTELNNLAMLYENLGRHREAEPLYKRSLAIWEKALSAEELEP